MVFRFDIEQNNSGFYKPEHVNTAIEAKDESEGEHDGSGEDHHYRLLLAPLWPVGGRVLSSLVLILCLNILFLNILADHLWSKIAVVTVLKSPNVLR